MRVRDILTALVTEARNTHWDGFGQHWKHQAAECTTCEAAMAAEATLRLKFLDFVQGDAVEVAAGVFGIVEHVAASVDVKIGYQLPDGRVLAWPDSPVGRFDAARLTRLPKSG